MGIRLTDHFRNGRLVGLPDGHSVKADNVADWGAMMFYRVDGFLPRALPETTIEIGGVRFYVVARTAEWLMVDVWHLDGEYMEYRKGQVEKRLQIVPYDEFIRGLR